MLHTYVVRKAIIIYFLKISVLNSKNYILTDLPQWHTYVHLNIMYEQCMYCSHAFTHTKVNSAVLRPIATDTLLHMYMYLYMYILYIYTPSLPSPSTRTRWWAIGILHPLLHVGLQVALNIHGRSSGGEVHIEQHLHRQEDKKTATYIHDH